MPSDLMWMSKVTDNCVSIYDLSYICVCFFFLNKHHNLPFYATQPCVAPSPRFIPLPEVERNKSVTVGQPIVLKCGISDHKAEVSWYKDREQLSGKHGLTMETEGKERKLIVASAHLSDSGHYSCAVADDAVSFKVDVQGDYFTTLSARFVACEVLTFVKFIFFSANFSPDWCLH